jgi:uncharacterized protein (UPF0147 family)
MSDEPTKFILGDTAISSVEEPPRRRRRKGKTPAPTHCENCGAELQGHWCAKCGQAAIDYRRSFRHVIVDVLDSFLNWDSKFFATIGWLIARPWFLTNEFLAGHRVRYLHPLRLYLLASILFFFAVNYWAKSIHLDGNKLGELSPKDRAELEEVLKDPNLPAVARAKIENALPRETAPPKAGKIEERSEQENSSRASAEKAEDMNKYGKLSPKDRAELEAVLKNPNLPVRARAKIEDALKRESPPPEPSETVEAVKQNGPPHSPTPETEKTNKPGETKQGDFGPIQLGPEKPSTPFEKWLESSLKEKVGEHGTNARFFLATLISNLPYMMLCCIPLFAFILRILYIRRGVLYIDHLIYALHIHTFAYVGIILIVLVTIGLDGVAPGSLAGWIVAFLWFAFAAQIFLSIRRVYRQGWFFSIFKFFVGGFVYLIVLLTGLVATILATLKWS